MDAADLQYIYDERYAIALGDRDDPESHEDARRVAEEAVRNYRAAMEQETG